MQKLYGARNAHTKHIRDINQNVDYAEHNSNVLQAFRDDVKAVIRRDAYHFGNDEKCELIKQNADGAAAYNNDKRRKKRFQPDDAGNVAFVHAEHIIETEFFFTLLHQKAVRVKQKYDGKQHDDGASEREHHLRRGTELRIIGKRI